MSDSQENYSFEKLPEYIQEKIKTGVESTFGKEKDNLNFVILAGGLSGTPVYKISAKDKNYVARVLGDNLLSSRKTIMFTDFAGKQGYGPKLYYPESKHFEASVMITALAKGASPKLEAFEDYKQKLANAVKKMHATPYESLPESEDMFKRIGNHFDKAKTIGPFLDDIIIIEKINNRLKLSHADYGFTHQDLTVGNILFDGVNFSFIDWPNGGFGDPIADVANLTFDFALKQEQALDFYELYLGKQPSGKQLAHFNLLRRVSAFRLAAFCFDQIYKMGGTYSPVKPKHSINRLIKMAQAGEFEPKTIEDFHQVLEAAYAQWLQDQDKLSGWLADLKEDNH